MHFERRTLASLYRRVVLVIALIDIYSLTTQDNLNDGLQSRLYDKHRLLYLFNLGQKNSRFLIRRFCKYKCSTRFLFLFFFFSAAQKAHQTSHFGSAHGTVRQYTFISIRFLYLKNKKKLMRKLF